MRDNEQMRDWSRLFLRHGAISSYRRAFVEGLHQVEQGGFVCPHGLAQFVGEHACWRIDPQLISTRGERDTEIAECGEKLCRGHTSNTSRGDLGLSSFSCAAMYELNAIDFTASLAVER